MWGVCEEFWAAFHALLTCSWPLLHELCLSTNSVKHVLRPILQLLPTLEILDFQLFAPDPATLVALTPAPGGQWLCPRLRALYFVNVAVLAELDIKGLISLVKARVPPGRGAWDGGSRPLGPSEGDDVVTEGRYLTELGVWNSKGMGGSEEEELQALGRKGGDKMQFTIQRDVVFVPGGEQEAKGAFSRLTAKQFR